MSFAVLGCSAYENFHNDLSYKKSLLPDHLFWDSETEKIADANHPLCSMFQALSSKASGCESV